MFLWCGTYGIRRGLWDCVVALMGHKLLDLWGPMGIYGDLCFCGVGPMGFVWVYGIAVLWDAYGIPMGFLWDAYGMPMGCIWDTYGIPVGYLWHAYGMHMGCLGHQIYHLGRL